MRHRRHPLPPLFQELNLEASRELCPNGFGTGSGRFHFVPTGTGTECARCSQSVEEILTTKEATV